MLQGALEVRLDGPIRIAPGQTRIVPLKLLQHSQFREDQLDVKPEIDRGDAHGQQGFRGGHESRSRLHTYTQGLTPLLFTVLPPALPGAGKDQVPIVALHGAGVDVVDLHTDFWAEAMPRNDATWIIMPSGRTTWGLDWHGPSSQDAWASVSALSDILQANDAWKEQSFPRDTKVVLIGHSNGGQGVWHLSTRFPDRVVAAVPAAGYIKSQAYIPLTHSRSAHFIDPALRAILETSLTPDDNDLHLSNIARLPLLAVHGGADENVPSWHSRELVSTLHTLNPESNSTFKEDPGKGHWYNSVLNGSTVQAFIDEHVQSVQQPISPGAFALTVSNPSESGSLNGWRIHSLAIPGRLGILRVTRSGYPDGQLKVSTTNIQHFYIDARSSLASATGVAIDDDYFAVGSLTQFPAGFVFNDGHWSRLPSTSQVVSLSPPPTRLQYILSFTGTIKILYDREAAFYVARRLSHDLLAYHRLDAELLDSAASPGEGTVIIGSLQSVHVQRILGREDAAVRLRSGKLYFGDKPVDTGVGNSYIFLHPASEPGKHLVVIIYTDEASLERAARLFPIRTGVTAPNWLHLSPRMDRLGAAGIQGAGLWGSDWKLRSESSWWAE
ncbi:hypothetical protein NMY22_g4823 [Coprinellus aureogranulatus]|nr:hypothetical protein NMY22_g4823 [Coprinellus aureogranulatus]